MTHQQEVTREFASSGGLSAHPFGGEPSPRAHVKGAEYASRIEALLEDVRRAISIDREAAQAAALRLASLLASPIVSEPTIKRGGLAPWQKRKIDGHLSANLDRPLRSEELADQVMLSVSHFCRAFKETYGTTPHTHVMRLRVDLAKRLMSTTGDPLSQIACACGLADQSHLTKLFQRYVGETPHAWRRSKQIDPRARSREDGPRASPLRGDDRRAAA